MKIVVPESLSIPDVPPAVYKATVTGLTRGVSQGKNTPQFKVELTLRSQGPDAKVKTIGRKFADFMALTAESLWRLDQLSQACGSGPLPKGEYSEEELEAKFHTLIFNKDVVVKFKAETWEGRTRTKVDSYVIPKAQAQTPSTTKAQPRKR